MTTGMHLGHLTNNSVQTLATIDKEDIERQRQHFFSNLLDALWPPSNTTQSPKGTFADCKAIKYSPELILKSFHVEGAGELRLPLSAKGASKLRTVCEQAPFGKGFNTVVDTRVRRCWQVDAANVVFPRGFLTSTIQPLAMKAVRALGFDGPGVQLEAHFYRLLFYEAGGHFKFHRDMEKEKGMFATMILQLPTEEGYTGGKIVVEYLGQKKEFDCHMVSALGLCYTVFFADCLHALEEIKSGTRLCLAFNLVKGNAFSNPEHSQFIARRVQKAEAALEPWWKEATERKFASRLLGEKLAIPLQHKYTQENLSFDGLKGDDSIVAEVLKECRDQNNEKWLELYLCLVTKHATGTSDSPPREYYYGGPAEEPDHHDMVDVTEEEISFANWIGLDDEPLSEAFLGLEIDLAKEVVDDEEGGPFDDVPDTEDYEDYMGNCGPTLEHWYHKAMLVVWPKALSISVACGVSVASALDLLENMATSDPSFVNQLTQVVSYCAKNSAKVWAAERGPGEDSLTPRLLFLCINSSAAEDVQQVFQVLATRSQEIKVGVRNAEVAAAIATAVQVFGWDLLSSHIMDLVKECAMTQGEPCAQLAKALINMGMDIAGRLVAQTIFGVFETHIAELQSHKMPEFTWCQPLARLPGEPVVEKFLKGPSEKLRVPIHGLLNARQFAGRYFHPYGYFKGSGYSARATAGGKGKEAFCEIQKTCQIYEATVELYRKEQASVQGLRLQLGNLRSAVPVMDAFANESEQHDRKRQRTDTEDVEVTTKKAKDSTGLLLQDDTTDHQVPKRFEMIESINLTSCAFSAD